MKPILYYASLKKIARDKQSSLFCQMDIAKAK